MSDDCSVSYGSGPLVGETIDSLMGRLSQIDTDVDNWEEKLREILEEALPSIAPSVATPTFSVTAPTGGSFITPSPTPTRPDISYTEPSAPDAYTPNAIDGFTSPDDPAWAVGFDDVFSTYVPGPKPTLPTYTAPTVTVPEIGDVPAVVAPDEPELLPLILPTYAGFVMPDLTGLEINPSGIASLGETFDYTDDPYAPELLDEMIAKVRSIFGGEMLIPAWIWDGIWSREVGNVKREELGAKRQARRTASAFGWILPGPVRLSREDAAQQKTFEAVAKISHENATKRAETVRQDLWGAVEKGLAIEQLLVNIHNSARERILKAAVESHNAALALYNAALEGYKITELMAKEAMIKLLEMQMKGEELKASVYESELKAAGLTIEIDKNLVEVYKAQWSGEDTKARAYAAHAQAIEAYVRGQQAAVEAFGQQVTSNNTILQGWVAEWDAYVKRLTPAELRIKAHEASSSHFGRLVQKYQADVQAEGQRVESDIKVENLWLQKLSSELERFKTLWAGIQTKVEAVTKLYAVDSEVFKTKSEAESTRVSAIHQRYDLDIKKAQLELSAKTDGLKLNLGYWERWMQTWATWQSAAVGAYAQLGASAYSAMNYSISGSASASEGYNASSSVSCSTSHSHSYDETG